MERLLSEATGAGEPVWAAPEGFCRLAPPPFTSLLGLCLFKRVFPFQTRSLLTPPPFKGGSVASLLRFDVFRSFRPLIRFGRRLTRF